MPEPRGPGSGGACRPGQAESPGNGSGPACCQSPAESPGNGPGPAYFQSPAESPGNGPFGPPDADGLPETSEPCCGGRPLPPASPFARPGYEMSPFVETFLPTPAGPVPVVKTVLDRRDAWGTLGARLGYARDGYRVAPGLYAVGRPGERSPVVVTADYKLSFDALRRELGGLDAWILVLDTRGINVWCAAGKGSFSARETARLVEATGLARVVAHRRLIVPQLAGPGLDAREVRRLCGFTAVFGPVRAADLPAFVRDGERAAPHMRRVTFSISERLALIPVELYLARKWLWWAVLAAVLLSGIGPEVFSLSAAWRRGVWFAAGVALGTLCGAVLVPALLPWIPGRAFAAKGALVGSVAGAGLALAAEVLSPGLVGPAGGASLALVSAGLGSWLAMGFTGSTPFASPSGVEREMRRAMPLQALGLVAAILAWVVDAFS
ncbi:mercury methylation corrinoid protein HgcA [Desulfolutivibrio sulfoxidireducens]|uniref:mercury methylation corrinoid protein HgcA n=1 Tax=Desulfolutivibrio sulfoxidireducens TaxID=2773299 RepID=UPI003B847370